MEQEKVNRSLAVSPRLFKTMGLFLHDAQKPQASQACWVSAEWGTQSVGHLQHHQALWEECGKILGVIKVDSALQPVRMLFVQCNAICTHVSVFQATLLIPFGSALPGSPPKTMDWVITGGQLESQSWKQKSSRDSLALSTAVPIPSSQLWALIPGVPERLTLLEHLNFLSWTSCNTVPSITVCITNTGGI